MDNKYDSAIRSFNAAISADPKFAAAHAAIGRVYEKQGLSDKAIAELEKSIELNPEETFSYWVLGEIYEKQGLLQKGQEYKNKSLSIVERLKKNEKRGESLELPR
jgi:tetratricopeptide (TPR) repeat protein